MLEIRTRDIRRLERQLGQYKHKAPVVLSRVLNRVATNARTNISKKTREEYIVKAADIKQTLEVKKSSRAQLGATITSTGKKVSLEKFKISPKVPKPSNPPDALKVAVKKDGNKNLLHAFVANIQGNKVFEREGTSRLPIKKLFGPAIPQMANNQEVRNFVESEAIEMFNKRFDHEVRRVLEGNR